MRFILLVGLLLLAIYVTPHQAVVLMGEVGLAVWFGGFVLFVLLLIDMRRLNAVLTRFALFLVRGSGPKRRSGADDALAALTPEMFASPPPPRRHRHLRLVSSRSDSL